MSSVAVTPPSTKKQILVTAGIILAVVVVLAVIKYFQIAAAIAQSKAFAPPPESVTSIVTTETSWPKTLEAVATLNAEQGVTLSAEEAGKVVRVAFESGSAVSKGDLLIELDTSVEEANLAAAVAKQEWTERQLTRSQRLRASNAVSQEVLDDALSQKRQADAEVESLRALIAKKKITAPFSGRTGIRLVNVGEFVAAGTALVPLHSLNPLYADFSLPQQDVASVAVGQRVEIAVDAFPGQNFSGVVSAVNPQVDASTRNVAVRATIENPEEKLRPGMFAQAKVVLPGEETFIALPATSVQYAPYGDTVYVIEKMKDPQGNEYTGVRQQVVKLGRRQGEQIAILNGLKPGEEIVTSGVFKLHSGAAVRVNNDFAPGNSLSPSPADT